MRGSSTTPDSQDLPAAHPQSQQWWSAVPLAVRPADSSGGPAEPSPAERLQSLPISFISSNLTSHCTDWTGNPDRHRHLILGRCRLCPPSSFTISFFFSLPPTAKYSVHNCVTAPTITTPPSSRLVARCPTNSCPASISILLMLTAHHPFQHRIEIPYTTLTSPRLPLRCLTWLVEPPPVVPVLLFCSLRNALVPQRHQLANLPRERY